MTVSLVLEITDSVLESLNPNTDSIANLQKWSVVTGL